MPVHSNRKDWAIDPSHLRFALFLFPAFHRTMKSSLAFRFATALLSATSLGVAFPVIAQEKETTNSTADAVVVVPEKAPDATAAEAPQSTLEAPAEAAPPAAEANPAPQSTLSGDKMGGEAKRGGPAVLQADSVRYAGDTVFLSAEAGRFVQVESDGALLRAQKIRIDAAHKTLRAEGMVRIERKRVVDREVYTPGLARGRGTERQRIPGRRTRSETVTEVLSGEDLTFDYAKRTGTFDRARVQLSALDIESSRIEINGQRYTARDVLLRPGGLSEAERRIYGTPPFNLRARSITVQSRAGASAHASVKNAAIYYKNTRLLPIPSAIFGLAAIGGPSRQRKVFTTIPRVSLGSADGILATVGLSFPLAPDAQRLSLNADIGLSQKVGFRGGLNLESRTPLGVLALRARRADIITTQLTNRIELDRTPELIYESPIVPIIRGTGGIGLGIDTVLSAGQFHERLRGSGFSTRSSRVQNLIELTTRLDDRDGPYLDLFRSAAHYSSAGTRYLNRGFEIGYAGDLTRRVRGIFSYRASHLSGATPFRFDEVEIPRELRTTFDVQVTPRYIVPIDLRYDIDAQSLRDKTFGLLRSYKTFAYGLEYQFARREFNLEFRAGF